MEALRHTITLPEGSVYYRISPKPADLPTSSIVKYFNELFRQFADLSLPRHPIEFKAGVVILNDLPSATPFGFA